MVHEEFLFEELILSFSVAQINLPTTELSSKSLVARVVFGFLSRNWSHWLTREDLLQSLYTWIYPKDTSAETSNTSETTLFFFIKLENNTMEKKSN